MDVPGGSRTPTARRRRMYGPRGSPMPPDTQNVLAPRKDRVTDGNRTRASRTTTSRAVRSHHSHHGASIRPRRAMCRYLPGHGESPAPERETDEASSVSGMLLAGVEPAPLDREPGLSRPRMPFRQRSSCAAPGAGGTPLHPGVPRRLTSQGRDSNPQLRGMNPARLPRSSTLHCTRPIDAARGRTSPGG
jgi:hypothetical protein